MRKKKKFGISGKEHFGITTQKINGREIPILLTDLDLPGWKKIPKRKQR